MKTVACLLGLGSFIGLLVVIALMIVACVSFDRNCSGHLKRAGDANTVELAKKELGIALEYIEENGLTKGHTSVIYNTPDEDVGFWYDNISSSMKELDELPEDASALDKSNILMKLRETLLDQTETGVTVTAPEGISRYPNNLTYGLSILFLLLFCGCGFLVEAIRVTRP